MKITSSGYDELLKDYIVFLEMLTGLLENPKELDNEEKRKAYAQSLRANELTILQHLKKQRADNPGFLMRFTS